MNFVSTKFTISSNNLSVFLFSSTVVQTNFATNARHKILRGPTPNCNNLKQLYSYEQNQIEKHLYLKILVFVSQKARPLTMQTVIQNAKCSNSTIKIYFQMNDPFLVCGGLNKIKKLTLCLKRMILSEKPIKTPRIIPSTISIGNFTIFHHILPLLRIYCFAYKL